MKSVAAALIAGTVLWSPVDLAAPPPPAEAGSLRLGIEPWLGYGPWHIAVAGQLFQSQGLAAVSLINFTEDKDINAALASGRLDAANIGTHTALAMVAAGLPIKIVLLLDVSLGADAILAGAAIATAADLKGRRIAFEPGTTSDILLNFALADAGLSITDIRPVPMPAADTGSALIAGRVDAAVTYEPYLSAALAQTKGLHIVVAAGARPGLVSDVLVVRDEVLHSRPGQVAALLRVWDAALATLRQRPAVGQRIIAKAVGAELSQLAPAFAGVRFYGLSDNRTLLGGSFQSSTFVDIANAAAAAGLLARRVTPGEVIDSHFVLEAP